MSVRTQFSVNGLNIGKADRNLTYYYGLSDFWHSMFEDSEKIELLLEANSYKLSDIYSKFLQLVSSISLQDIEIATSQQIKLVLIKDTDAVVGQVNTYALSETITSSRLIANRPLLPTAYLEAGVHYRISDDGAQIQFFEPITSVGFASRLLSDGSKEFSLWFVDSLVDEEFVWKHYGKLIGVDPQLSTEAFKSFIYGLYYLYTNGPNLALLRKGLNLALGIPLARDTETVLDIRKYLNTDQFVVITDLNSYLIPFGLEPTASIGDTLSPTEELAKWIEVKDYIHDGDWWINLAVPPALMPYIPTGQPDRYAKAGTYADYIMRTFLKQHTFLVNVKTIDFKNLQSFEQLSTIINEVKPSYSYPIYIWTVPTLDETITVDDSSLTKQWVQPKYEILTVPTNRFKRFLPQYNGFNEAHSSISKTYGASYKLSDDTSFSSSRASIISMPASTGNYYWEATIKKLPADILTPQLRLGIGTSAADLSLPTGQGSTSWGFEGTTSFLSGITGEKWTLNGISRIRRDRANFLRLLAASGCYLSTPDTVGNSITGDIEFVVKVALDDWSLAANQTFVSKHNATASNFGWQVYNLSGSLVLKATTTGNSFDITATSTVPHGFVNYSTHWIKVNRISSSGVIKFYYSENGTDWTQLGANVTTTSGSLFDSPQDIRLGATASGGTTDTLRGNIYYSEIRSGIDGLAAVKFDASQGNPGETSAITTSLNNVWTFNGTASIGTELGNYYLDLNTLGYATTPDTAANSITSDIDLRAKLSATSWTPSSEGTIIAKWTSAGSPRSYAVTLLNSGALKFYYSTTGSDAVSATSSTGVPFINGQLGWVKVTRQSSTGDVKFWTSVDGVTWTQLGSTQTTSAGAIFDSAAIVTVGSSADFSFPLSGKAYVAEIRSGIDGSLAARLSVDDAKTLSGGNKVTNNVKTVYGLALKLNDVVGFVYDSTAASLKVYINNADQGTAFTGITGTQFPMFSSIHPDTRVEFNFGDRDFAYSVPSNTQAGIYTELDYLTRDVPYFTRSTVSHFMSGQFGEQSQINGAVRTYEGGVITGYVNPVSQLRSNTLEERAWFRSEFTRDSEAFRPHRSVIAFTRNNTVSDNSGLGERQFKQNQVDKRAIFLYNTTQQDIESKFALVGAQPPSLATWVSTLFSPFLVGNEGINTEGINEGSTLQSFLIAMQNSFNTLFFPPSIRYLGAFMPKVGYDSYAPQVTDLRDGDYLLFIRVYEKTVGVYWVTSNNVVVPTCFRVAEVTDPNSIESDNSPLRRGLSAYSSYYTIRGGGGTFTFPVGLAINEDGINEGPVDTTSTITISYADEKNPTPVIVDRNGTVLKFRRDFK